MKDSSQITAATRLTARGAKTKDRIVSTAAGLMRVRGVGATTLDEVVAAGKVSKSQLYRHFADKQALVRAVVAFVGERKIASERELLENVRTFAGLRRWRDAVVGNNALHHGRYGCALGSLAAEVSDHDEAAREQVQELFATWRELFEGVLERFRADGLIPGDADVPKLAVGFVAMVQGGYLLAQTELDVTPMVTAIDLVISHLELLSGH